MPSVLGNTPLDTQIALASDVSGGGNKPTHIYNTAGTDALDDKGQLFVSTIGGNYWTAGNNKVYQYRSFNGTSYIWSINPLNVNYAIYYNPTTGEIIEHNEYTHPYNWVRGTVQTGLDPTNGDIIPGLPDATTSFGTGLAFTPKQQVLNATPYAKFALESLPDRMWAAGTWNVGDLVKYNSKAYRCIAAATSSNTSAPSSDTTHWAEIALLSDKAPLASPAFTGTPTAPTASSGTNTTQVANTAFVQTAIASAVQDLDLSIVSGKLCVSFEE